MCWIYCIRSLQEDAVGGGSRCKLSWPLPQTDESAEIMKIGEKTNTAQYL